MATKRSKRIDPNAAFAAIVGTGEPAVDAPSPTPLDEGAACTVSDDAAIDAIGSAVINNDPSSIPYPGVRPPAGASAVQDAIAENIQQAGAALPNRQESPEEANAEYAAAQQAAGGVNDQADGEAALPSPTARLVQKGYYITEEQHKRLGIFSVMQGTDRSAIVRKALDMYFEVNKEQL